MVMSALLLKADMCSATSDVGYVPEADIRESELRKKGGGLLKVERYRIIRLWTRPLSVGLGRWPGPEILRSFH